MASPSEFSPAELGDLARYLTTPCACKLRYRIAVVVAANGTRHYRFQCVACGRLCGGSILRAALPPNILAASVIGDNTDPARACARCGATNGVELHHWAPAAVFKDFYRWPTAWLCPACHTEWHDKMSATPWAHARRFRT